MATQWQSKSLAGYTSVLRVTCRWSVKHWVVSYKSCISKSISIWLECPTPTGARTVPRSNVALEWQWTCITYIVCSHHDTNLAHHIALTWFNMKWFVHAMDGTNAICSWRHCPRKPSLWLTYSTRGRLTTSHAWQHNIQWHILLIY